MLGVFFGTDRKRVKDASNDWLSKNGTEDRIVLETFEYEKGELGNLIGSDSLFGGYKTIIIDTPSAEEEMEEELHSLLPDIAEGSHVVAILEGSLLAAEKKQYQKHAQVFEEFQADKAERFNSFAMADALARKDKRRLWLILEGAKQAGLREEELIGIMWWQLKSLRLAATTTSAEEAGMKDFPYRKAKGSLKNFKAGELEDLSLSLLDTYHKGHQGIHDLDLALEEWVLTI